MRHATALASSVLLLALVAPKAHAADMSKPHPHEGVLAPFKGAPPAVELTKDELAALAGGNPVRTQTRGADGGRGMAIQDVHADPETVWGRITDYAAYPKMVGDVKICEVYERAGDHVKVRFVLGSWGVRVEYFIDHLYRPKEGFMTWTLDYSRTSDLDDSVGFWFVQALAERPGWTRVYYSVAVRMGGWIPGFVEDIIAKKGLESATSWVKRESEKAREATPAGK